MLTHFFCSPYMIFVRAFVVQSRGLDSLADTARITSPERHPGQRAPGECGKFGRTSAGSADVRGSDPVESLGTECVVVPWENLVDLCVGFCQLSETLQQRPGGDTAAVEPSIHEKPIAV